MAESERLLGRDPGLGQHRGIDPTVRINAGHGRCHLKRQPVGAREIDRLAEPMIDRADHIYAVAPDAIPHGKESRFVVGAKGKMLHRASSAGQRAIARMGNTHGDRNLVDVGKLNNRKIAAVIHAQEGVQASRNPVHVKKCNQRTAHHLGEEGDMLLYVCCHDRDVVDSARLLLRRRHRSVPYLTLVID